MSEQDQPEPRRPHQKRWILIGAGAAVAVALAVVLPLTLTGSSGGDPLTGYGMKAADVARHLKACASVEPVGDNDEVVRCISASGDNIGIVTSDNENTQDLTVAMIKDKHDGQCAVVTPGVIIAAGTSAALTSVIGIPEGYAAKHDGYMLCPS